LKASYGRFAIIRTTDGKFNRLAQTMDNIDRAFDRAMREIYLRAKNEAGYTASIFQNMLSDLGGLATAKRLINAPKVSDGYAALYLRNRLDLTVEAVIVDNPKWHALFTPEEIERAKKRLKQFKYKPKHSSTQQGRRRG
jgi:hypothetical protein